ncbi:hypothetical protein [Natronorubrum sp. A-ect3]|uniref:hypothetical protein n=1 Tax=Natronorubrum sp. A-ect3 TaxID=3242698 RepID=UPI00359EFAE4
MSDDTPDNEEIAHMVAKALDHDLDDSDIQRLTDLADQTEVPEEEIEEMIEEADDGDELAEMYAERKRELIEDYTP